MTQLLNDVLISGKAEAGRLQFSPIGVAVEQLGNALVEDWQLKKNNQNRLFESLPNLEEDGDSLAETGILPVVRGDGSWRLGDKNFFPIPQPRRDGHLACRILTLKAAAAFLLHLIENGKSSPQPLIRRRTLSYQLLKEKTNDEDFGN